MQQITLQLKSLSSDNVNDAGLLNVYMKELNTVQNAVAQLMERIDEIQHKGWDKDKGMAYLAIGEIEQTVRLIDMAFLPLTNRLAETVGELNTSSEHIYKLIVKEVNTNELNEVITG